VFHRRFDCDESSFEENNTGAGLRIAMTRRDTRHTISYTFA
jgi:hypothetical protein